MENHSNPKLANYKWLFQLTLVFFVSGMLALIKNVFLFGNNRTIYDISLTIVSAAALIIVSWLILKALKNPELFSGVYSDMQLVKTMVNSKTRGSPLNISEPDQKPNTELIDGLSVHMKKTSRFWIHH